MFDFLSKQFIDVIEWTDEPGVLAFAIRCRIARSRTAPS